MTTNKTNPNLRISTPKTKGHHQYLVTTLSKPKPHSNSTSPQNSRTQMAQNNNTTNKRRKPNILITGTPGTGKTTTSSALAESTQFRHINIGDLVKDKSLHDGWDEQFDCYVINEDLVCDELEEVMEEGGNIVDYHGCDFFPERWFHRVVVLQTDNSVLYDRLSKRGYSETKISNNVECEIFQMMLEEAKESYAEEIVVALRSDTIEDISNNVAALTDWIVNWQPVS